MTASSDTKVLVTVTVVENVPAGATAVPAPFSVLQNSRPRPLSKRHSEMKTGSVAAQPAPLT